MINKYFILSIISLVMFFFVACKEDIDLSTDGKETAVVYALLDQTDSIHYVRINRAFYGGTNALEIAQIPDSSYFDSTQVDAFVYEISNSDTLRRFRLRDTLVFNKDNNGVFFAPKQRLYYFETDKNSPLNDALNYRVDISINKNKFRVQGGTQLIRNSKIIKALSGDISFSFASYNAGKLIYNPISVNFSPGSAVVSNVSLDIYIKEFLDDNKSQIKKINWNLGNVNLSKGANNSISTNGENFYKKIKSQCTDFNVLKRVLYRIDVNLMFCSSEFIEYQKSLYPSSSLAQSKIEYTNLTVTNGMRVKGLFSSRKNEIYQILPYKLNSSDKLINRAIDQSSMKELCQGQYTGNLNFCSDVPSDSKETYYCK